MAAQSLTVAPGNEHFQRTWERPDQPVLDGVVARTWMWGPDAFTNVMIEPYEESPDGEREVQYFDKSRMEITQPTTGDPDTIWYVTNGLLVNELVTGQLQLGDAEFEQRAPAGINVAGDVDGTTGPTYWTIGLLLDEPDQAVGTVLRRRLHRDSSITFEPDLGDQNVTIAVVDDVTEHGIAAPFWEFMNSTGTVFEGGQYVEAQLFQNPYIATGRPIVEPYWASVKVANVTRDVLIQCFERRCLTYTPGNPDGFVVEAGNVGQHYYDWRYAGVEPPAAPTATTPAATATTPPATATSTSPAPTATSTPTVPPTATPTATTPAPTATSPPQNCHPSYPDHCIAPPPPDLNCADLPSSWKPIRVLHNVPNPDPHDFDRDSDGWGCVSG